MVALFIDGFDKYGPAGQTTPAVASLMTANEWTSWNGATLSIAAPLSATGQAVVLSGNTSFTGLTKTVPNTARIIGGFRFSASAVSLTGVALMHLADAGVSQCCITLNSSSLTLSLRNGLINGTVLATSVGAISLNSTHYLEWDITIGASAAYQVWLDGVSIISGTGNTKVSANNYTNTVLLANGYVGGASTWTIDDLYLFDSTGTTNNAPLLNNPIVETALPSADQQAQWTSGATIIGNDNSLTAATNAPGANFLFLRTFTAPCNMTLNSLSCVPQATAGAAKFKPVIYGAAGATGAHRYWRVFQNTTGGSTATVAEIQFRTTAGTPLLFSGGTASANTGTASNATDNNPATNLVGSGTGNNWFAYDYGVGVTMTIAEVMLQAANSGPTGTWLNFDLQWSDDGSAWNEVANFTASTWSIGQIQLFQVASRPTAVGSPGSSLIAAGNEVVGTISGNTLTATFASGQSLISGTTYAIGFITDTSVVLTEQDTNTTGLKIANTYTSGAPATLPTPSTGQVNWKIWGNCTGAAVNYACLINNPAIDDIAYVSDSTVGHEDLYGFPALSSNPAAIACVAYKARVKRSDSGARTIDVRCLSGAADSAGSASGFTPGSSFGWVDTYFPTDPNTGVAWTGTAVNAAAAGPKVAS